MQHGVQQERIQAILNGRRSEAFSQRSPLTISDDDDLPPSPSLPAAQAVDGHQQQTTLPPTGSVTPLQTGDTLLQQTTPLHTPTRTPLHTPNAYQQQVTAHLHTNSEHHQQTTLPYIAAQQPQTMPPHIASRTPIHTNNAHQQQTTPPHTITRTPLHANSAHSPQMVPLHNSTRTPLQTLNRNTTHDTTFTPPNNQPQRKTTNYMSLLEDEHCTYEFPALNVPSPARDWESFAAHFTSEFESLKAEVEMLRSEVRQLKKAHKEAKVIY